VLHVVFFYLLAVRHFRDATSLVAVTVPVSRAVRRIGVEKAEGSSGVDRGVLTHLHVLSRPGGDPWTRRTSSGAGFRDQARATIVHALRHVADCPHMAAQLIHLPVRAEGLHLAAVHAEVHVADATDLAVVSGVGVYHLDEIGVTGVQTVHQAWSDKRTRGIQADYSVNNVASSF